MNTIGDLLAAKGTFIVTPQEAQKYIFESSHKILIYSIDIKRHEIVIQKTGKYFFQNKVIKLENGFTIKTMSAGDLP